MEVGEVAPLQKKSSPPTEKNELLAPYDTCISDTSRFLSDKDSALLGVQAS